jgi:hypothetical protein
MKACGTSLWRLLREMPRLRSSTWRGLPRTCIAFSRLACCRSLLTLQVRCTPLV